MERACIIYNPAARNAPSLVPLSAAAAAMLDHGWEIELQSTLRAGHATQLAKMAVERGASVVFACGGDGTLNEVVNGLAGTSVSLAVLRGGMGDVFGKEAGIPRAPREALQVLVDGVRHRFDLGVAGNRYFLLMCGIGLDATVVRAVPGAPKRWLGSTSYAIWCARELLRYRPRTTQFCIDGVEHEAPLYWLLLGNTRSYGGIATITAKARIDDGVLDSYVFEGHGMSWVARTALRLATHRQDGGQGVTYRQIRELEVKTAGLPVQIDGEYIGETPMRFSIAPSMLEMLLPRGKAEVLWQRSD